jgi:excisionase family DNA binding protein
MPIDDPRKLVDDWLRGMPAAVENPAANSPVEEVMPPAPDQLHVPNVPDEIGNPVTSPSLEEVAAGEGEPQPARRRQPPRKMMTLYEVAEDLEVPYENVRRLVREHKIPSLQVGRIWRVPRKEYQEWKHRVSGGTVA